MAQWWEHSPPTNVARVQIPASTPYVGWVCCWFSPLLREVLLRVLRFSPLLKNQHFQIPIRPGIRYTKNHYVNVLPANRYFIYLFIYLFSVSPPGLPASRVWDNLYNSKFPTQFCSNLGKKSFFQTWLWPKSLGDVSVGRCSRNVSTSALWLDL